MLDSGSVLKFFNSMPFSLRAADLLVIAAGVADAVGTLTHTGIRKECLNCAGPYLQCNSNIIMLVYTHLYSILDTHSYLVRKSILVSSAS